MAAAVLGDLTGAAGHDILMAFSAALRVVGRPEAVCDLLHFLEHESIVVEGLTRLHVIGVDAFERRALLRRAVGHVIEAGLGFGRRGLGRTTPGVLAPGAVIAGAVPEGRSMSMPPLGVNLWRRVLPS